MKKTIILIMLSILMIVTTSCDAKRECDFCGEEKKCVEKTVMGESMYICDDCMDEINEFYE